MRKITTFILCSFFIFSIFTIENIAQTPETSPQKSVIKKDFPNPFRPIGNLFSRIFGKRKRFVCNLGPNVTALTLSHSEVDSDCPKSATTCSNNKVIEVHSLAASPEEMKYVYTVSGGKIIGDGANIKWDLSDDKTGTHTITAGISYPVSGKWGVWGTTQTKTVTVK